MTTTAAAEIAAEIGVPPPPTAPWTRRDLHMRRVAHERLPILGDIVTYTLHPQVEVHYTELDRLIAEYDLSVPPLKPFHIKAAILRALERLARLGVLAPEGPPPELVPLRGTKQHADHARSFVTKTVDVQDRFVYVVKFPVRRPEDDEIDYTTQYRVVYDKTTQGISFSSPAAERFLRPLIQHHGSYYNSRDITANVIIPVLLDQMNGFRIRADGGAYFIPYTDGARAAVYRLEAFIVRLQEITHRPCECLPIELVDSEANQQRMIVYAVERLGECVQAVTAQIDKTLAGQRKMRAKTLTTLLDRIDQIKAQARLYTETLAYEIDNLDQVMTRLTTSLRRLMTGDFAPGVTGVLIADDAPATQMPLVNGMP